MQAAALALALLAAVPAARAGDDYDDMARGLAAAARKAGVRRLAVVGLRGADSAGAAAVSERLLSRLASEEGIEVVERGLLEKVLEEQKLAQSGATEARGAAPLKLAGVDALVTGTLIKTASRRTELNVRLIRADDARVLGAARGTVRPDWQEELRVADDLPVPPPPALTADFTAWWERGKAKSDPSCAGWEERVDSLQVYALPLKVRHWAQRLQGGVDRGSLTRNPGSEIRSLRTRARFYAALERASEEGAEPLNAGETTALETSERSADALIERCGS